MSRRREACDLNSVEITTEYHLSGPGDTRVRTHARILLCADYTLYTASNGQSAESPIVSNKHAKWGVPLILAGYPKSMIEIYISSVKRMRT